MEQVIVKTVTNEIEGEIICGLLRTEKITCFLRRGGPLMYGFQGGDILVDASDAARARELIDAGR
jgi:hypothetical protein